MSWAEIKKAVNSNISTPLNTLISNLIRDFKSQFEIDNFSKVEEVLINSKSEGHKV